MNSPIGKARGEGNCVRATGGGKEAGTSAARLRIETSYQAGPVRRVSTTSRSRSQIIGQVKGELVRRQITFLSGETGTHSIRRSASSGEIRHARSRKGPWHMAKTIASGVGLNNAWLHAQGQLSLKTLWAQLAPLRRTAWCGPAC